MALADVLDSEAELAPLFEETWSAGKDSGTGCNVGVLMVAEADAEGVQTGPEDMSSEKFTLVLPALALSDVATAAAVVVRDGRGPVTCPTYSRLALARVSEAGSMRHNGPLGKNNVKLFKGDAATADEVYHLK